MNCFARFAFAGASSTALVLPACSGSSLPGTVLGTYKVVGQVQTNSCGLGAPNPWIFDVQISEDRTTRYWSWLDGTPPLSSPLTTVSNVTLTAARQVNADSKADGGLGPCTMDRADRVEVTLGGGSPPASFAGTISYAFSVASGSDCSDQLTASQGQYDALPCAISYTVAASRQ